MTILAVYALAFVVGIAVFSPRKERERPFLRRHDESLAPSSKQMREARFYGWRG